MHVLVFQTLNTVHGQRETVEQQLPHVPTHAHTLHTAFMYYYDNPKGMIPTWLINWAAKASTMTATV